MTSDALPVVFEGDGSDFSAARQAEQWIRARGWSVGPTDRSHIRAVMFGPDWVIAKWRNLTECERGRTDAVLQGSGRKGPLTLYALVSHKSRYA